jgi:hypothetical protein
MMQQVTIRSALVVALALTGVAHAAPAGPPAGKTAEDKASVATAAAPAQQSDISAKALPQVDKALAKAVEKKLGIQIRGLRMSAAGFMLDFRYRVVDPAKAKPLLDPKNRPYLEDGKGARLGVVSSPKIGAIRSITRGTPRMDADYAVLFGNPGGYLKQGSLVTMVIGDQKIGDLTVE